MICNSCETVISENAKFCNKCGQKTDKIYIHTPNKKRGWGSILMTVISILILYTAFHVVRYLTQETFSPSENNSNYSRAELISKTVDEAKASLSLPNQITETTMLVDMTAESNAIRYHYLLSGIDTSEPIYENLKDYLDSNLCKDKEIKNLLDRNIDLEYSYSVKNSSQKYFITYTKTDCE